MELIVGITAGLIIGLIGGGAACWLVRGAQAKSDLKSQQAAHREETASQQAAHREETASQQIEYREEIAELRGKLEHVENAQTMLDTAKKQLNEAFESTASRALQRNNQAFLTVANENFGKTLETAKGEFARRRQQFEDLVKPLSESYGKLNPQIEALTTQVQSVTDKTARLSEALTDNRQVGNWGEVQLRRVVEVAGMVRYCDFAEQPTAEGSGGRPDMVINLPNNRAVVVDAKASTAAFLASQGASNEEEASAELVKHANALKGQVDALSKKNYGAGISGALEFVVMFVPGDQFLSAALRANPGLIEYGMQHHVAIATPASLIALLWTVSNGWQQDRIAQNAREIQKVGEEMHKRLQTFVNHYEDVGKGLDRAVGAYNRSVGSFDRNVVPQGRRFAELTLDDEDAFPHVDVIEGSPRTSKYATTRALQSEDEAA